MFPKAHAAAYVMMALRVAYFKVHHPIYYYCAYFSIRAKAFELKTMSAGLDAVKARMEDIKEKRQRNEATNVENDLFTTLEIVNEMLERGFTFGQLDLYKSQATEFLIEGDTLIPPFIALEGLGENVAKQVVAAREEGEFLLNAAHILSAQIHLKFWQKSQHPLLHCAHMVPCRVQDMQAVAPCQLALDRVDGRSGVIVNIITVKPRK